MLVPIFIYERLTNGGVTVDYVSETLGIGRKEAAKLLKGFGAKRCRRTKLWILVSVC